ncbi:hypothetical protein C2S51_017818 [Perilla frutescens var. frutescens]|nr:hypothetical protein C2S51_017818 [Perilla frutescens var. frutescens]
MFLTWKVENASSEISLFGLRKQSSLLLLNVILVASWESLNAEEGKEMQVEEKGESITVLGFGHGVRGYYGICRSGGVWVTWLKSRVQKNFGALTFVLRDVRVDNFGSKAYQHVFTILEVRLINTCSVAASKAKSVVSISI